MYPVERWSLKMPSSRPRPQLLDKIPGPMDAKFLCSVGLGFGTRIGRAQLCPTPALDKNRLPKHGSTDRPVSQGFRVVAYKKD